MVSERIATEASEPEKLDGEIRIRVVKKFAQQDAETRPFATTFIVAFPGSGALSSDDQLTERWLAVSMEALEGEW